MYVKVGKFRKVRGKKFYTARLELDRKSADRLFGLGLRLLIKAEKAKVTVLTPDEAKALGIKPGKIVKISKADYNACISAAVVEALKEKIASKK